MSENIVIDTQLWEFFYAMPKEEEFKGIHIEANVFVKEMLEREEILVVDQKSWESGTISVLPLRDEIVREGIRL